MSLDNWDSEDFHPPTPSNQPPSTKNKWEGEDEEEEIKDSWDQEPEENAAPPLATEVPRAKKSTKKLGEKFEEKERKRKEEEEENIEIEEFIEDMTPEEKLAEKLYRQKLQEDADLSLAREVFGATTGSLESKEDFDQLKEDFLKKINDAVKNSNYANFVEELIQDLCTPLPATDLKKIHSWIGNLHLEKGKLERGDKKKTKAKGRAKLKMDEDFNEYQDYIEDFDDFI